ncbi:MAG: hypothetical protein QXG54_06135 [Desulfurococcaceae archaeon]
MKSTSDKYVEVPKEDTEIIYEVIHEVKPPSKLREIIMYLAIGVGAGVGLGVLIHVLK